MDINKIALLVCCIVMCLNAFLSLYAEIRKRRRIQEVLDSRREERNKNNSKKFDQIVATDKLPDNTTKVYTKQGTVNVETEDPFLASAIAQCFVSGEPVISNRTDYEDEVEDDD